MSTNVGPGDGLSTHLRPGGLLEGRVAVVTGGAGGIGDAVCRTFAAHGAAVVVADDDSPRAEATAEAVRDLGARALIVVGDLTTAAGIATLPDAAVEPFEPVAILANGLGHHPGRDRKSDGAGKSVSVRVSPG